MMYILINKQNVVVDILSYIRYIKLQPSSGLVIGCEGTKGTGVIGSDANTHYVLADSDTQSNPNAVQIIEIEEIPSEVIANIYQEKENGQKVVLPNIYKYEDNQFIFCNTLDELKVKKQEENKILFAEYLATHPITWVDGKLYGITEQDQSEIHFNINQYNLQIIAGVESPTLEWHAKQEESCAWSLEDLTALSLEIQKNVEPLYHKMQQYKTQIYNCQTREELNNILISYTE